MFSVLVAKRFIWRMFGVRLASEAIKQQQKVRKKQVQLPASIVLRYRRSVLGQDPRQARVSAPDPDLDPNRTNIALASLPLEGKVARPEAVTDEVALLRSNRVVAAHSVRHAPFPVAATASLLQPGSP